MGEQPGSPPSWRVSELQLRCFVSARAWREGHPRQEVHNRDGGSGGALPLPLGPQTQTRAGSGPLNTFLPEHICPDNCFNHPLLLLLLFSR